MSMDQLHKFVKAPLSLANSHSLAARHIELHCKNMNVRDENGQQQLVGMMISSIVLRALALELYLKSLSFCLTSRCPHIHKLRDLFAPIEKSDTGACIGRRFQEVTGRALDAFLREVDDAFVFWRYVHEKLDRGLVVNCDTDEMDALSKILSDAVNFELRRVRPAP